VGLRRTTAASRAECKRASRTREFEYVIRACANATAGNEFLIIGSQSILGSVPDAPRELRVSMELDVCPLPFTESAAAITNNFNYSRVGR